MPLNPLEPKFHPTLMLSPHAIAARAQIDAMDRLLSADATYRALHDAVNSLVATAPPDHDVLVEAFGIAVHNVSLYPPHTIVLSGKDSRGQDASAVIHFSQLVVMVVHRPKKDSLRLVTGFSTAGRTP